MHLTQQLPPVRNGPILASVQSACAFVIFAGGSPCDMMRKYEISHSEVMESVWYAVQGMNQLDKFKIEYPESAEKQEKIAWKFQAVS